MATESASRKWAKGHGVDAKIARKAHVALAALADMEGLLKEVAHAGKVTLHNGGGAAFDYAHMDVCAVLRAIDDAWSFGEMPR